MRQRASLRFDVRESIVERIPYVRASRAKGKRKERARLRETCLEDVSRSASFFVRETFCAVRKEVGFVRRNPSASSDASKLARIDLRSIVGRQGPRDVERKHLFSRRRIESKAKKERLAESRRRDQGRREIRVAFLRTQSAKHARRRKQGSGKPSKDETPRRNEPSKGFRERRVGEWNARTSP